jgi:hypothetical protein
MKTMLMSLIAAKKEKPLFFQVLLLRNDGNEGVEVQEGERIDFVKVERHLARGGSVFITSKNSQKLVLPKDTKAH